MPDAIFAHPRLALIYDAFEDERDDLTAYAAIAAELGARSVVDIGCGTGSLAVLLAERGLTVVGVDPSRPSLDVARGKDVQGRVTWVDGDATAVPAVAADLAVMTGNVAQVFLGDDEWTAALRAVHAAVRPGGHLVFETRRPERRAWEDWHGEEERDVPGVGRVVQRLEVTSVDLPYVSFRHTCRFAVDGEVITSDSTLRFRDRDEVAESLTATGYRVVDVRDAPDRPGRENVFIALRR
ncbi:class I SAM-dependent methyltransferase [Saccharothrix obliqua]|uniref:class I SAM-dependent methyltransferase n=1 Tax=Saccharothrix obliqua TaxID=2861747 RepID=UPI001C5FD22D|nr:class I SAM-dependent methyltransferase [Saccharothrix obliqua]MBW4719654.1 class I SAM-dependent methyltransferase [Saccharothrix obliqua]